MKPKYKQIRSRYNEMRLWYEKMSRGTKKKKL